MMNILFFSTFMMISYVSSEPALYRRHPCNRHHEIFCARRNFTKCDFEYHIAERSNRFESIERIAAAHFRWQVISDRSLPSVARRGEERRRALGS